MGSELATRVRKVGPDLAGEAHEVGEHRVAMGGAHRLGVELHAVDRPRRVLHRHDKPIVGRACGDAQAARQ